MIIWKFFKLLCRFGFINTLLLLSTKLPFKETMHICVKIAGFGKMYLRPRTSDFSVFMQIFFREEYNCSKLPQNANVILDCGANIGLSTIFFATLYPEATVVALEPESSNFSMLQKNTARLQNIICMNKALWSTSTVLGMVDCNAQKWAFRMRECSGEGEVVSISIPEIMEQHGFDRIDILKIDVEGGEEKVFSGCCDWINKVGMLIIELHDYIASGSSKAFYSKVCTREFTQSIRGENVIICFKEEEFCTPEAEDTAEATFAS